MVRQVINARIAQAEGEPTPQMKAPVNFFHRDHVNSPADEKSGHKSGVQKVLAENRRHTVHHEERHYVHRRLPKGRMFSFFRSSNAAVMLKMSFAKQSRGTVKQPPMIDVLKSV